MEIVLYYPGKGYYTCGEDIYTNYFTSPKFHYSFGKCLTKKLLELWQKMERPVPFFIMETGSGDGLLCKQILNFSNKLNNDFYKAIRYILLSINSSYNTPQEKITIIEYNGSHIPVKNLNGCLLSNELIDSFPVHLVIMKDSVLKEIFITLKDDKLAEIIDKPSTHEINDYFSKNGITLKEGNRGEVNLTALKWMRDISEILNGYIITIDYGYEREELFSEERKEGTLLCYYLHSMNNNPLKRIGYQDITGHVDFTSLMDEGEKNNLITEEYKTQRDFLLEMGIMDEIKSLDRKTMNLQDYNQNLNNMERLIDIRGLGNIKVLIQRKERFNEQR
jgi:SAM-dependent MidA family methyltransferase